MDIYPPSASGRKICYFAQSTNDNLELILEACKHDPKDTAKLQLSQVFAIEQQAIDCLSVPSGFIHTVYTAEPTVMFTGDFLTSFDVTCSESGVAEPVVDKIDL